ncbi:PREDICTED: putative F-box protein At1g47790 [Brassica oleracea var. oleracea]|uniref:putative F-box protein At1g47790 n=1 Tax=Brassica oleracea var. oleracea TaxID=109376 RepID=UPI0006A7346A|nr:PREDICTED: putative F-box protein At1g47790 [Brassica oleracea var. oleracea]
MELKEKKKKTNYKKRRIQYKKGRIQYIPTDLTIEILSRLPEKSIARFSFVSKLWLSITTDPFFPRPRLVLCFQNYYDLYVSSIPQHTQNSNRSYSSSLSIDYHHSMKLPVDFIHYPSTESVHGVICFELKKPIVWNPSTRKFITLPTIPRPCKDWRKITLLLGYDPVECKHKVVCIPYKRICYVCRIFTLGSAQESWRTIKVNHKHHSGMHAYGRCIEGVIYYISYNRHQSRGYVVMSFDVGSENFDMIKLPSEFYGDKLIIYKGRLAYFSEIIHREKYRILWILEDAQQHKWSRQDFFQHFGDIDRSFKLTGFTHAGEFIYVPKRVSRSFNILLCDPVRNSWRRFEFKGLANEVSVHNGVEEDDDDDDDDDDEYRPYELDAFPNHIDSQMSL